MIDPAFAPFAELLPEPTEQTAPFWDGLAEGVLRLQRCAACARAQYPPESFCYECGATDLAWEDVPGHGEVHSFIVVHQPYHPAFRDRLPYVSAAVQLDEGPRMLGAMFEIAPSDARIGMRVQPRIERVSADRAALFFEPER